MASDAEDVSAPLRRLELLARAVSGATITLATTRADRAYVDGASIAVPWDENGDPADAVSALVVQASLIAVGSLTPSQVDGLRRARPATRERYLVLEAARAARVPGLIPPRIAARVGGLAAPETESAAASLDLAQGRAVVPPAPAWLGTIKPGVLRRRAAADPRLGEAAEVAVNLELADPDVGEDGDRSRLSTLMDSPIGASRLSRSLSKLLGASGGDGTAGSGGAGVAGSGTRPGARGQAGRVVPGQGFSAAGAAGPQVLGIEYPEWDCHRGVYRLAWCMVHPLDPPLLPEVAPLPASADVLLRRELARLGTAPERRKHLRDGDVLDDCAVIEHEVQRRLGDPGEPRVFEARTRTARDLGILVILDATGSMGGAGRTLFDDQRLVAHRLTTALEELGDRVATYAFRSSGRSDVRFLRIKEFDGRYDEAARARLASITPAEFTRLGAAIRHGTDLLSRNAGTSHQLLVVVGDGLPYDDGYEDQYAREDSRVALREALAAGVGCVSIGVGTSQEPSVVEDVWGEVTHLHLADGDDLDGQVRDAFGSALRLAVARRRAPGGAALRRSIA